MNLGSYFGKVISSGLFQLWFTAGILSQLNLNLASLVMLVVLFTYLLGKFIYFHISLLIKIIVNKLSTIAIYFAIILSLLVIILINKLI